MTHSGSRFNNHVALAIKPHSVGLATDGERGDAREVVRRALTDVSDEETSALGEAKAVDGSVGRGAEGWIAVLEFALEFTAEGLIVNAMWDGVKVGARQLRNLLKKLRGRKVDVMVSRGAAQLIAIGYVLDHGEETGILDVESVSDPKAMAGQMPTELSYVGIEPWLVSLVNETRTYRFIVAVSPSGEAIASMRFPLDEWEAKLFGVLPPRA
jgi:hypothetical protein